MANAIIVLSDDGSRVAGTARRIKLGILVLALTSPKLEPVRGDVESREN